MLLTVTQLRDLAQQAIADGRAMPPVDAADVIGHMASDDRNVRVAALRVLAFADGPDAATGILRGLDDSQKRVREVAAKSSVRCLGDARVVDRLRRAVENSETGSAGPAFEVLAGVYTSTYGLSTVQSVPDAMAALAELPKYRQRVLVALIRSRSLTDDAAALLRDFVTHGTKDEAVMATRRLCGLRVARREELSGEEVRTAERAWGDLWYWARADSKTP